MHKRHGFTLMELLVVVAILGVLAAVIVPNVGKFIGSGTKQSANTEAHDVQAAVLAYVADNNATTITGGGSVGPSNDIGPGANGTSVHSFLANAPGLQAVYTIDSSGNITAASPILGSKWGSLTWSAATGWH